jgi:hypothetical protein
VPPFVLRAGGAPSEGGGPGSAQPPPAAAGGAGSRRPAFRLRVVPAPTPAGFDELVRDPVAGEPLVRGVVFVHDKAPLVDRLLDLVQEHAPTGVSLTDASRRADLTWLASQLARRRRTRSTVFVLRAAADAAVTDLVRAACAGRAGRNGLWVLGFPVDFPASVLRLFDVIVMFGSSTADRDKLQSLMPLPASHTKLDNLHTTVGQEEAMVFYNTEATRREWTIRLQDNPVVLPFRAPEAGAALRPGHRMG